MNLNDFYDIVYKHSKDIGFYVDMAQKYGKDGVLEIGSGTGRILLEIAKKGINIDGLEPNKERFNSCKEKINSLANDTKKHINIFPLFSSDFKTDKKYSLIIMPFRMLQEITSVEHQEEILREMQALLTPDGVLIFDLWHPSPKSLCLFENNQNAELTKKQITENNKTFSTSFVIEKINTIKQTFSAKKVYECDGEKTSYQWNSRYLTKFETEYLLKYLGFKIVDVLGDFEMTPFNDTENPKDMVFVVKK